MRSRALLILLLALGNLACECQEARIWAEIQVAGQPETRQSYSIGSRASDSDPSVAPSYFEAQQDAVRHPDTSDLVQGLILSHIGGFSEVAFSFNLPMAEGELRPAGDPGVPLFHYSLDETQTASTGYIVRRAGTPLAMDVHLEPPWGPPVVLEVFYFERDGALNCDGWP